LVLGLTVVTASAVRADFGVCGADGDLKAAAREARRADSFTASAVVYGPLVAAIEWEFFLGWGSPPKPGKNQCTVTLTRLGREISREAKWVRPEGRTAGRFMPLIPLAQGTYEVRLNLENARQYVQEVKVDYGIHFELVRVPLLTYVDYDYQGEKPRRKDVSVRDFVSGYDLCTNLLARPVELRGLFGRRFRLKNNSRGEHVEVRLPGVATFDLHPDAEVTFSERTVATSPLGSTYEVRLEHGTMTGRSLRAKRPFTWANYVKHPPSVGVTRMPPSLGRIASCTVMPAGACDATTNRDAAVRSVLARRTRSVRQEHAWP
jgi:hypothetical protein